MPERPLTHANGALVVDNLKIQTAGPRGPALLQDIWLLEKLGHFQREVIPECRMHAKGSGAYGNFTVTEDITRLTKARLFAERGKRTARRDARGWQSEHHTKLLSQFSVGTDHPARPSRSPLPPEGAVAHRVDDDHCERSGDLLRLMPNSQRQALFDNTARSITGADHHIQHRHITNCPGADPACSTGGPAALGFDLIAAAE